MMFTIVLFVAFIQSSMAATCINAGSGPCVGTCPAGQVCATFAGNQVCCLTSQLVAVTTARATTCVDLLNPTTGVSDCPSRAYLCSNAAYYTLMTQQCPRTCGRCSTTSVTVSTTCYDRLNPTTGVSDCPSRAYLCNNASYYTLMTQQCPRTCGRCTTSTSVVSSTTCVDLVNASTGVSECASKAYLCNNSAYYTLMTQQCPRTCGRCTSG